LVGVPKARQTTVRMGETGLCANRWMVTAPAVGLICGYNARRLQHMRLIASARMVGAAKWWNRGPVAGLAVVLVVAAPAARSVIATCSV
jgi:hypothetical protein